MAFNLGEQIEHWGHKQGRYSNRWEKQKKHRRERRKAKQDPQCVVGYRKYSGWAY